MKELDEQLLKETYGGALSAGLCAVIASGVSFIVGIIDGITRPFKCR